MNIADYPPNWPELSQFVRFTRAEGRCECTGECGLIRHELASAATRHPRCPAIQGQPSPYSGNRVVLTTAHLDQDPASDDTGRMKAMCQSCHLAYDRLPDQRALRERVKLLASRHGRELGEAGAGADEREDPAGSA